MILNTVRLITSESCVRSQSRFFSTTLRTTPGPLMPTFSVTSGSPTPWYAPAMNGLSSGALTNTTNLAQPIASGVRAAVASSIGPSRLTASRFSPACVEPTLRNAHTRSVPASTAGSASISTASDRVSPFCTSPPKPPMKSIPASRAARSSVCAIARYFSGVACVSMIRLTGVIEMRLLTMGMPYLTSSGRACSINARAYPLTRR